MKCFGCPRFISSKKQERVLSELVSCNGPRRYGLLERTFVMREPNPKLECAGLMHYWEVEADLSLPVDLWREWSNSRRLMSGHLRANRFGCCRGRGIGFPEFPEPPLLTVSRQEDVPVPMTRLGPHLLVTRAARDVLTGVDPGAFQFVETLTHYPGRDPQGGIYWIGDVTRCCRACIDMSQSVATLIEQVDFPASPWPDGKWRTLTMPESVSFIPEKVHGYHAFRSDWMPSRIFVSDTMKAALEQAGCWGVVYRDQYTLNGPYHACRHRS